MEYSTGLVLIHLCQVDSSTLWTGSFHYKECLVSFYCFIAIPVLNANRISPDQTLRSAFRSYGPDTTGGYTDGQTHTRTALGKT